MIKGKLLKKLLNMLTLKIVE